MPKAICLLICLITTIIFPTEIANGVRDGLLLLGDSLIPALFPFMVLASYLADSPLFYLSAHILHKPSKRLFNVSGTGLITVILGMLGGYPIGAKLTSQLYENGYLSKSDTHRLLCWCINPSPSFVITAVGTFMLRNTKSGILLYCANILASFTIGLAVRFLVFKERDNNPVTKYIEQRNVFISAVASASKAMLSICGWVLLFSAIAAGLECIIHYERVTLFIKTISEVTTGCRFAACDGFSLPVICAVTGFGGFAVIFQIAPYLEKCNFSLKQFICWRIINGALSAFYCSVFIKIFPDTVSTIYSFNAGEAVYNISHSPVAAIILMLTCILLILEVDNKRKLC